MKTLQLKSLAKWLPMLLLPLLFAACSDNDEPADNGPLGAKVQITETLQNSIDFTVTPSTNDPYVVTIYDRETYEFYYNTPEEYVEDYFKWLEENNFDWEENKSHIYRGIQKKNYDELETECDYTMFIIFLDSNHNPIGVDIHNFKTADDPNVSQELRKWFGHYTVTATHSLQTSERVADFSLMEKPVTFDFTLTYNRQDSTKALVRGWSAWTDKWYFSTAQLAGDHSLQLMTGLQQYDTDKEDMVTRWMPVGRIDGASEPEVLPVSIPAFTLSANGNHIECTPFVGEVETPEGKNVHFETLTFDIFGLKSNGDIVPYETQKDCYPVLPAGQFTITRKP